MSVTKPGRTLYRNARIVDPASGHDGPGELLTIGEDIADVGKKLFDTSRFRDLAQLIEGRISLTQRDNVRFIAQNV